MVVVRAEAMNYFSSRRDRHFTPEAEMLMIFDETRNNPLCCSGTVLGDDWPYLRGKFVEIGQII